MFNVNFMMFMTAGASLPVVPNNSLGLDFVFRGLPFAYITNGAPLVDGLEQVKDGLPYGVTFI